MNPGKNRRIFVIGLIVIVLAIIVSFGLYVSKRNANKQSSASTFNVYPAQDVILVVSNYLQARENSVGADQATPTSWLNSIRSISTSVWFNSLQPPPGSSTTSNSSADYQLAHDSGYVIKTSVTNCRWVTNNTEPVTDKGTVSCDLTDSTINQATGNPVDASELPFGWTHNGPQQAAVLNVVKQNGSWLVSGENNSSGE